MLTKFLISLAVTATMVEGLAFSVFDAFKASTKLSDVTDSKMGEKFTVMMDIGQKDGMHMNLNGLSFEMLQDKANRDETVGLPGADGPHPKTSTGALALNVLEHPAFIDMYGQQKVRFEKACYEIIWKKDMYSGNLICGFNLPVGAKRNGANLPAGRLYLNFPIWSQEGLALRQAEKFDAEAKCKEYQQEKNEELQKYAEAKNPFKKMLHYRNAVAAVEKIDFTGIRWLDDIPTNGDVTPIGNGLLLNTKGTIWNKESNFFGAKHILLGDAVLRPIVEEAEENILRP